MDIDTFITLFSAIKAHTIFLTNCFKPNNEKFDYILAPDFNTIAKLSLASCALLCIKEDLIETNKNLILCKTIPSSLEKCVNEIREIRNTKTKPKILGRK